MRRAAVAPACASSPGRQPNASPARNASPGLDAPSRLCGPSADTPRRPRGGLLRVRSVVIRLGSGFACRAHSIRLWGGDVGGGRADLGGWCLVFSVALRLLPGRLRFVARRPLGVAHPCSLCSKEARLILFIPLSAVKPCLWKTFMSGVIFPGRSLGLEIFRLASWSWPLGAGLLLLVRFAVGPLAASSCPGSSFPQRVAVVRCLRLPSAPAQAAGPARQAGRSRLGDRVVQPGAARGSASSTARTHSGASCA